ncbi:methyltransferase regulatory domain-containing protein [Achromobacter xylosoxidans]|uniref:Methyltransferase n=1 Tax=Alcaligenes xylosoxydans xylosoxydans TaxID=85698 RepID=A0A424W687_ALCXX|nr:class I SAM-dependent methyltransferase [Achromobacter xylosoxidans]MBC9908344.1 class I SAM-dependent methyltransferase [Achromobacter xylosoxidans]MBD0872114.1 class I SAM-dependent methyltransferase [Achromobacter xylosoxidans]QNP83533.1 class I SAM-dependent methyltransferase [Achromobacter xylosoxidans]RPJ88728.1 methyltransferase [Achromobacter xylosoxidans]
MTSPDSLNQAISDAYDETPYTSNAFPICAPGHLHAVAHLYGLNAPAPETARVLELGCAAGGNLLPFVLANPGARAVGVDLSPQQIAAGKAMVDAMGLDNLELRAMSITDIDASFGKFDYIICHGVFSWVPPEVREAILRVCRENLSADGIAYVSYNTYPGWKASDVVRDAMLLNSFAANTPQEKLTRAKEMLSLLENGLWAGNSMKGALSYAAQQLSKQTDYYLTHEYLEAINSPCYFLEFVAAIQQAGLAYLTDAEPQATFPSTFGENVANHLAVLSVETTREMREQYLDFAMGRQFRKSLLVHADRAAAALENPEGTKFADMHFAAKLQSQPSSKPSERAYQASGGGTITTESPALIAILETFREAWPASVPYARLAEVVAINTPDMSDEARDSALLNSLILLIGASALHYRLAPVPYSANGTKPQLIPGALAILTAIEARTSQVGMHNLWHQTVNPGTDSLARFVTPRLDGTRSMLELRTELRDALHAGHVEHPQGRPVKGVRNLEPVAQELLQAMLASLKNSGLMLR